MHCAFCGKPLSDDEIVTDDHEGVACQKCASAEIAAQNTERRLEKLKALGFDDAAEFARKPNAD